MAVLFPFPLWQRTSRVYQDHRLYGSAPPVSTRITASFPTGPNFLRPACPYPGCQLSSFAGSCPMVIIPADYWLILCCLLTPVSVQQHLSADVS